MTTDSQRFSIGDRVVLIKDLAALRKNATAGNEYYYGNNGLTPGAVGTVVGLSKELKIAGFNSGGTHADDVLVEWDEKNISLHDGGGLGRSHHCWIVRPDHIRHDAPLIIQEDFLAVLHGGRA